MTSQPNARRVVVMGSGFQHMMKARGPLLRALAAEGHEVIVVTPPGSDAETAALTSWGVAFEPLPFRKAGINPFGDALYLYRLVGLLRRLGPDVLLAFTIKAVIYGMLAGALTKVDRRVAMITGLGYAFMDGREPRRRIARLVGSVGYRLALSASQRVIFQNRDDLQLFQDQGVLPPEANVVLVDGSGVDTTHFNHAPTPPGPPRVLMLARLLRDKGVYEYVDAARLVRAERPDVVFVLAGAIDENPTAVRPAEVQSWTAEGVVDYVGEVADVRPLISGSHVFALPSYREGLPLAVLEAMSMGRPIVTTDAPGCRETVHEARNGRIVPVRDAVKLAEAILDVVSDEDRMREEGVASRELAEKRFDSKRVVRATMDAMLL